MSTGALLGFGSNGQPLENPGGGVSYYDKLNFAEYLHSTEDHFDGELIETLSYLVEPDPDDASQQRFAPQYSRDIDNHVWGSKANSEHRFGYERNYQGGSYTDITPSYETWLVDQATYDSQVDPMTEAWLYHPDGYLSPLYRGFLINPIPDPLNVSSGNAPTGYLGGVTGFGGFLMGRYGGPSNGVFTECGLNCNESWVVYTEAVAPSYSRFRGHKWLSVAIVNHYTDDIVPEARYWAYSYVSEPFIEGHKHNYGTV